MFMYKDLEDDARGLFLVTIRHLSGEGEENNENLGQDIW
jgi:hypothetical protein